MREPTDWDQMIQAYFEDELPPDDRAAVEAQAAQDPAFRTRLEAYRWAHAGLVEAAGRRAAFDAQFPYPTPAAPWRRWARIAAVLIPLLLIAAVWYSLQQRYAVGPWLAAYPVQQTYRGDWRAVSPDGEPDRLSLAEQALQRQAFAEAIALAHSISPQDTASYPAAQLIQGVAHLGQQEPEQAIAVLTPLLTEPPSPDYLPDIHWLLALGYLAQQDWPAARHHLQWLVTENPYGYLQPEARAWLRRLDSFWFNWFN